MAAAPSLLVGGLLLTTFGGTDDGSAPVTDQVAVASPRPAQLPVPGRGGSAGRTGRAPAMGVRPDIVVVPALGVRAHVTPIATRSGALTPPSDPRDVGWWSGGARPGAGTGAAVITGHTVHTGGGAFDDLDELQAGDRVVVMSGRRRVSYDVSSVRVLSRAELARQSSRIFARSGPGRLVLITCEDWDGAAYRSNVVVTARPA